MTTTDPRASDLLAEHITSEPFTATTVRQYTEAADGLGGCTSIRSISDHAAVSMLTVVAVGTTVARLQVRSTGQITADTYGPDVCAITITHDDGSLSVVGLPYTLEQFAEKINDIITAQRIADAQPVPY